MVARLARFTVTEMMGAFLSAVYGIARLFTWHPKSVETSNRTVERVAALKRAIRALSGNTRVVFILHDVKGMSHDQIARMLQISPEASRMKLKVARIKIRHILKQSQRGA